MRQARPTVFPGSRCARSSRSTVAGFNFSIAAASSTVRVTSSSLITVSCRQSISHSSRLLLSTSHSVYLGLYVCSALLIEWVLAALGARRPHFLRYKGLKINRLQGAHLDGPLR